MGIFEPFNEMGLSSKPDFYSYYHFIYVGIDMGIGGPIILDSESKQKYII